MVSTSLLPKLVVRAMKLWAGSPIRALENALMKLEEKSFRCGNAYSAGAGFRSADLKVTTTICTIEEICTDTNFN